MNGRPLLSWTLRGCWRNISASSTSSCGSEGVGPFQGESSSLPGPVAASKPLQRSPKGYQRTEDDRAMESRHISLSFVSSSAPWQESFRLRERKPDSDPPWQDAARWVSNGRVVAKELGFHSHLFLRGDVFPIANATRDLTRWTSWLLN